ncbi:MAG: diacylglycerol/lipid kinase family protein [Actinomycetota bacterium]
MRRPPSFVVWGALSVLMYASRNRMLRRAALRGLLAGALTRLGALLFRHDNAEEAVSLAYVTAASLEEPKASPLLVLAAAGLHWDDEGDAARRVAAGALAAGVALVSTKVWPAAPRLGATAPKLWLPQKAEPNPDGSGITIVINTASGPDDETGVQSLRELLPGANLVEVEPTDGDEIRKALDQAVQEGAVALGISGGDGSINTAAQVAIEADRPLLVVPGGTFNHLAQAVGISSLEDAVSAVKNGDAVGVDVATIGGHVFLNTASFGSYVELVDTRQRLEDRIGKWPAMVLALIRVLRHSEPIEVEIDGARKTVWMAFLGNCRYHPSGFAPTWRERLDDGMVDVRYVSGDQPFARTRLILAVLTGRLGRSKVYNQSCVETVRLRGIEGPLRLARDGETFDGPEDVIVEKLARRLVVFASHPEGG